MFHRRLHPGARAARGEAGFTLIELLVAISVMALIGLVMGQAFTVGVRTSSSVGHRVKKTDDTQRIATYWTRDVQSIDTDGYDPPGVTCGSGGSEVVTFSWQADLGTGATNAARTVTWAGVGSGSSATLVRRTCKDGDPTPISTVTVATDFMDANTTVANAVTGTCFTAYCEIKLTGASGYSLRVSRRTQAVGTFGLPATPSTPSVAAVGSFSPTSALAVGKAVPLVSGGPAQCAVYVGNATTFSRVILNIPTCTSDLHGVAVVSANIAYAVGANGTILRCSANCSSVTGGTWTMLTVGSDTYYAATAQLNSSNAPTDVIMAVGSGGRVEVCPSACGTLASWVKSTSTSFSAGGLGGTALTLTSASALNIASASKSVALVTAVGTKDAAGVANGYLVRCTSNCFTAGATWSIAGDNTSNGLPGLSGGVGTGQLNAVSIWAVGVGSNGIVVGAHGTILRCANTCIDASSGPSWSKVTTSIAQPQDLIAVSVNASNAVAVATGGNAASCQDIASNCGGTSASSKWNFRGYAGVNFTGVTATSDPAHAFMVADGRFIYATYVSATATYSFLPLSLA